MYPHKRILIVEDDFDDRELLIDAIRSRESAPEIAVAENGRQAVEYLESLKGDSRMPCLIVLDLNLPYLSGHTVFDELRKNAALRDVPVIVFTSSLSPHDKDHFTSMGVEFISKPMDYKEMDQIAAHILEVCIGNTIG
ncbi:MAG: response regulator [Chitinophagaceae bacterium]|nr:MAG: response regulator [Chitinophagaceae bacterium]